MVPEDQEAVFKVWQHAVAVTHDFLSPEDKAEITQLVREEYIPQAHLIVALNKDRIVGFMGMTDLTIDALFIDPSYFGRGIGRAFIEQARKRGGPLSVDVNEYNQGAATFYLKMGFKKIDRSDTDDQGRPYPLLHLRE
ncbi:MAG: acetyltransferase [Hyphococcus sp.]|nr:MAG: acetyltransferase [Marinicaulis sp.]